MNIQTIADLGYIKAYAELLDNEPSSESSNPVVEIAPKRIIDMVEGILARETPMV
jgi:hypothetical protein